MVKADYRFSEVKLLITLKQIMFKIKTQKLRGLSKQMANTISDFSSSKIYHFTHGY